MMGLTAAVEAAMLALVKTKAGPGLEMAEVPEPAVGINDVLIRVRKAGICGTDLHIASWDAWAERTIRPPLVVGHEFVGEIVEVGSNVSDFRPGDIVSGEGHVVCGRCRHCMAGQRHLCAHSIGLGVGRDGAFAEYVALPMANVWHHWPGIDEDVAAIFDPFGNAVHTALRFEVLGEDVLVTGAGPIGLMAIAVVRHAGARHVVVSEPNAYRRALAERMGATRRGGPGLGRSHGRPARAGHGGGLRRRPRDVGPGGGHPHGHRQHGPWRTHGAAGHPQRAGQPGPGRGHLQDADHQRHLRPPDVRDLVQDERHAPVRPGHPTGHHASLRLPGPRHGLRHRQLGRSRGRCCSTGACRERAGSRPRTPDVPGTGAGRVAPGDPLAFVSEAVLSLRAQHLYRPLRRLSSAQGPVCVVDGREVISFSSNDYLGLTHHPRLRAAAEQAVRDFGVGSGAVRTIAGTLDLHEQLEEDLADFKQVEATLVFQSGFTANTGVIPAIAGVADLLVSDALNHASIIDGMRLSRARREVYAHKDVAALRTVLANAVAHGHPETGEPYRLILVVTDGVFSMDGDICPLPGIVEAAEEHGAAVLIDDAHASGVLGDHGRGTVDHFGLHGRVAIQVGTLSKAVGVLGGYVAGSAALRDLLTQWARPFLFSTSHPPAVAAACIEALRVMQEEDGLFERLWTNTRRFKTELARLGFDTGASETPITPILVGDSEAAIRFSDRLFEAGVFATSVVYPTVPLDGARLRTIVTAAHTDEHLDRALETMARVGRELGLIG